ncbi:hypothetical protein ACWCQ0_20630 [Streptomyces massasporeus]|uniref:Uncharacterized protein n=1 Tax=Streptomyces massasporeus TaxID=67324 RepID=A0ABW6L8R1_9ACTN
MESGLFCAGYHGLGLDGPFASDAVKAPAVVSASAFRFGVHRTWVFRHEEPAAPAPGRGAT